MIVPQDYVGLRFLIQDGLFMQWVVSAFEAKQILSGFINGTLKPVIGNPEAPFGGGWCVMTSSIRAIHTFNPVEMQQAAPPQGPPVKYGAIPGQIGYSSGI